MFSLVSIFRRPLDAKTFGDRYQEQYRLAEIAFSVIVATTRIILRDPRMDLDACSIDIPDMIHVAVELLRLPISINSLYDLFVTFSADIASSVANRHLFENKPALYLLIASLRGVDVFRRVLSLECLYAIQPSTPPRSIRELDLNDERQFTKGASSLPRDFWAEIDHSDVTAIKKNLLRCITAIKAASDNGDFRALGLELYSVFSGPSFLLTTRPCPGSPGVHILDAFPDCANAIRKKGIPSELYIAEFLDLKYAYHTSPINVIHEKAEEAIKKYPDQGYFYYYRAVETTDVIGYQMARQGLKCKGISPYLQRLLLGVAAKHAFSPGVSLLKYLRRRPKDRMIEYAVRLLTNGGRDFDQCLTASPQDTYHIDEMCIMSLLVDMVLSGPLLSDDLHDFKVNFRLFP
jgi:hypothetical protein